MSRIRTIKPEFWTSEQVMECSPLARLAFIGMWNFCDDNGVHPASCKTLKAQVFPGDNITVADVQSMVDELLNQQLVAEFEADNHNWWVVTGWYHQLINRPSMSRYPLPPHKAQKTANAHGTLSEDSVNAHGTLSEDSVNAHGTLSEDSVNAHGTLSEDSVQEGKGRERKGKEGKGREEERAHAKATLKDAPSAPTLKGCRISIETLPPDWKAWAEQERPDLDAQRTFDTFRDYWLGKPGTDGMKLNWMATWRNWVRREHAQTRNATPRNGTPVSQLSRTGQQQVNNAKAWLQQHTTIEAEVISSELN